MNSDSEGGLSGGSSSTVGVSVTACLSRDAHAVRARRLDLADAGPARQRAERSPVRASSRSRRSPTRTASLRADAREHRARRRRRETMRALTPFAELRDHVRRDAEAAQLEDQAIDVDVGAQLAELARLD